MNKRSIKVIVMVVIVALLVGAYFAVVKISDSENTKETTTQTVTYTVSMLDLNSVYQFGYTYKDAEYAFRLNDAGNSWTWDGNPSLPISNMKVALMLTHFAQMTSTVAIDGLTQDMLNEYGLVEPELEMYFKDKNGLHSFKVGTVNPYNSLVYILSSANKNCVYMVSADMVEEFSCTIDSMLQVEENSSFSSNESITLTVENESDKLAYTFYPNGKSEHISKNCKWFLSVNGQEEFPINEELGNDISAALKSNIFAKFITYDESKHVDYGLSEKKLKVTVTGTNVKISVDPSTGEQTETKSAMNFSFYLGDIDEDGFSYAMTDNSPLVYITTASIYEELCAFNKDILSSIRSAYVWNVDESDLSEVSFKYDGKDYVLTVSESATGVKCTLNGNDIPYESVKALIKNISVISWDNDISNVSESTTSKETMLEISIKANGISAGASFSGYSDEYYRVAVNGYDELLILRSNLDKIISELVKII